MNKFIILTLIVQLLDYDGVIGADPKSLLFLF